MTNEQNEEGASHIAPLLPEWVTHNTYGCQCGGRHPMSTYCPSRVERELPDSELVYLSDGHKAGVVICPGCEQTIYVRSDDGATECGGPDEGACSVAVFALTDDRVMAEAEWSELHADSLPSVSLALVTASAHTHAAGQS